jgi:hypothetical protein
MPPMLLTLALEFILTIQPCPLSSWCWCIKCQRSRTTSRRIMVIRCRSGTGLCRAYARDVTRAPSKTIEKRGFDVQIGSDGWPTDPRHPSNRKWSR